MLIRQKMIFFAWDNVIIFLVMSSMLYNLVFSLVDTHVGLFSNNIISGHHTLHNNDGQEMTIYIGECMPFFLCNGYIQKINVSIRRNDMTTEFTLFFENEDIRECAKKKGNVLYEISKEEIEYTLSTFFEMDEIKEPYSE